MTGAQTERRFMYIRVLFLICNFVEFHHGELTSPVVIKNKLPEKISEFSVKKWVVARHFKFSKESAKKYKGKYGNLVFLHFMLQNWEEWLFLHF